MSKFCILENNFILLCGNFNLSQSSGFYYALPPTFPSLLSFLKNCLLDLRLLFSFLCSEFSKHLLKAFFVPGALPCAPLLSQILRKQVLWNCGIESRVQYLLFLFCFFVFFFGYKNNIYFQKNTQIITKYKNRE